MEVRTGYKQTEAGVIPEDWRLSSMGEEAELLTGFPFPSAGFTKSGVRLLRGSNVKRGEVDWSTDITQYWPAIGAKTQAYELRAGDLVIAMDGALVGRSFATIGASDLPALLVQRVARLRSNKSVQGLLRAWVASDFFVRHVDLVKTHTAIPHISPKDIREFAVVVPSAKAEQDAIAQALSDIDALLAGLDRLIAKKRDLKQAAMQQLLTGQTRLPGFQGEWEHVTLKRAAEISTGINKPVSEMGRGVLYVTVQDLYHGTSIRTEQLGRIQVSAAEIATRALEPGDIVFGKSSVKREGIGYPSQFLGSSEPVVFSGFTYRARARVEVADSTFLFYALRSSPVRHWLIDNSQASALTNINQRIADAIPLALPPLAEQTAIAAVLSDMDAELTALEARRAKSRALKQGMMQELLTGRTRLVRPEQEGAPAC